MSVSIHGTGVSSGIAIGRAVMIASGRADVAHYFVPVSQIEAEIARIKQAKDAVLAELSGLHSALTQAQIQDAPADVAAMIDVHIMLLEDQTLQDGVVHWIAHRHYNAEWALQTQFEILARQFDEMQDEYLRERKADLEQVVDRVLKALQGKRAGLPHHLQDGSDHGALVLVAHDVSPADMLLFKESVFGAFVTEVGGKTSHTAIVARSMDVPAVVGARGASQLIRQDDMLVVDGNQGLILVNPSDESLAQYRDKQLAAAKERAQLARLSSTATLTLDGQAVELLANIERPEDAHAALSAGAVGVGLFRSEFLFMNRGGDLPDEEEQYRAYRRAVEGMQGRPVTIRTVDVGADKPLNARVSRDDSHLNPALGLRAIRWCLAEPVMFRTQIRAILRSACHGKVNILIPMLGSGREITQTLEHVAQAKRELDLNGHEYGPIQLGAMIEIPAAALMLPLFLRHFDFLSIGTNDLIQYTLAIDRADESVAQLYDCLHPAVLRLIADTIAQADAAGKDVSVCGEMAGDPALTPLLLGMGLRSFSMHASQILTVKREVLASDARALAPWASQAVRCDDPAAFLERMP